MPSLGFPDILLDSTSVFFLDGNGADENQHPNDRHSYQIYIYLNQAWKIGYYNHIHHDHYK